MDYNIDEKAVSRVSLKFTKTLKIWNLKLPLPLSYSLGLTFTSEVGSYIVPRIYSVASPLAYHQIRCNY